MGKCIVHTEREASFHCAKNDTFLCDECVKCADPKIYCKFRPSCNIWFALKYDEEEGIKTKGVGDG